MALISRELVFRPLLVFIGSVLVVMRWDRVFVAFELGQAPVLRAIRVMLVVDMMVLPDAAVRMLS